MRTLRFSAALFCLSLIATLSFAQSQELNLPRPSQHAVVTQRIGITDITVNYHRPLTNGRKIWGGIVPYGEVWRAGANENTTITFSDPVTIEGKPLDAGTYGLHMIPNENEWTVIFSKAATAWGSFSYKQDEDALRVTVKPAAAEPHDALTYDFDQLKPDSAVVTMRWDKVAVPFSVAVDVNKVVAASLQKQLRGLPQYDWQAWDDAANYFVAAKFDLPQGLKDVDQSIQIEERYDNLMTKANILDAMGQKDQATVARNQALSKASAIQMYGYARQLLRDKKQTEAFAVFRDAAKKYPDAWITHAGLARVYTGDGNYDAAVKEMKLSIAGAPENVKPQVEGLLKRLEAKENINQ